MIRPGQADDSASSRWPLAFVIVSLLALALVPLAIDRKEAEIESEVTDVLDPAREISVDLALVHARQIARFQSYLLSGDRESFDRYNEDRQREQGLYDRLVALGDGMDLDVRTRLAALQAKANEWHLLHSTALDSDSARLAFMRDLTAEQARNEELLLANNALTDAIFRRLDDARVRMDRERSLEIWFTIGLVGLALLATILVSSIGQRLQALISEAMAQRESADRARREVNAILEATGDGVLGLDLYGRCTFLNPAGARLLGFGENELTGRDVHEVLHQSGPGGHPRERCPIIAAIASGATVREPEDVVWGRDGEPIPVQWTLEPLIKGAAVRGAVLTFTDMSDIRKAQEGLRQAVRARDEVVAVVSHDLRNPLGTIAAAAGLMLELELPPEKRHEHLRMIVRATERMNRLIGDLLDVARIESGGLSVATEVVEIQPLLEEAVELLEPLAQEKGLGLFVQVTPGVRAVRADRDRMLQVLSNLVGNAVKFSRHGGVRLSVERGPENTAVFAVADTGPGIPPEAAEHVFDRFWRQNQADRQGAGLGLAIVRGIVLAHGGKVWVESKVGEGSIFFFTLPAATPEARGELASASAARELRP
jgi:PAS domain S-box-containing protein